MSSDESDSKLRSGLDFLIDIALLLFHKIWGNQISDVCLCISYVAYSLSLSVNTGFLGIGGRNVLAR